MRRGASTLVGMKTRTDLWTASRVDAALILLPLIGVIEAERMLFAAGIRTSVIERVIHRPEERRAVRETVPDELPYFGQA